MDIEKDSNREAFERLPLAELAINCKYVFYNEITNSYWPAEDYCPSDAPETMNFAWEAWQAAKAQAEKALLEQFEINNKLVEQIEKLKADVPWQITVTHERFQELIAIAVKTLLDEREKE